LFDVDLTRGDERNEKNELELGRVLAGAPTWTIRSERGSEGILPEVLAGDGRVARVEMLMRPQSFTKGDGVEPMAAGPDTAFLNTL